MKKLDWTRLLGFSQIADGREGKMLANSRIGGKVGGKDRLTPGT